jgi:hypothetical protein
VPYVELAKAVGGDGHAGHPLYLRGPPGEGARPPLL